MMVQRRKFETEVRTIRTSVTPGEGNSKLQIHYIRSNYCYCDITQLCRFELPSKNLLILWYHFMKFGNNLQFVTTNIRVKTPCEDTILIGQVISQNQCACLYLGIRRLCIGILVMIFAFFGPVFPRKRTFLSSWRIRIWGGIQSKSLHITLFDRVLSGNRSF